MAKKTDDLNVVVLPIPEGESYAEGLARGLYEKAANFLLGKKAKTKSKAELKEWRDFYQNELVASLMPPLVAAMKEAVGEAASTEVLKLKLEVAETRVAAAENAVDAANARRELAEERADRADRVVEMVEDRSERTTRGDDGWAIADTFKGQVQQLEDEKDQGRIDLILWRMFEDAIRRMKEAIAAARARGETLNIEQAIEAAWPANLSESMYASGPHMHKMVNRLRGGLHREALPRGQRAKSGPWWYRAERLLQEQNARDEAEEQRRRRRRRRGEGMPAFQTQALLSGATLLKLSNADQDGTVRIEAVGRDAQEWARAEDSILGVAWQFHRDVPTARVPDDPGLIDRLGDIYPNTSLVLKDYDPPRRRMPRGDDFDLPHGSSVDQLLSNEELAPAAEFVAGESMGRLRRTRRY